MDGAQTEAKAKETLVVAYDGSPAARRALMHAVSLARRRAVIAVVNVVRAQSVSSRLVTISDRERLRQEQLLREAQVFVEDRGVQCRTIAAAGDPSAEILAVVEDLGARWLVLGRGDRKHRLRRSVSVRLARAAKCDVVFVR